MADDQSTNVPEDYKKLIELLEEFIEALKGKRCYDRIKISRSATESGSGKGNASQIQTALDDAIDKATDAAVEKVRKYADKWCRKGSCSTGECKPSIDFTTDVSGKEFTMPEAGKEIDYSFTLKVTATGQISCVCKS